MIVRPKEFGIRYRVIELWHVTEGDEISPEHAFGGESREFRTIEGAEAFQKKLTDAGKAALFQVGVVQWFTNEDADIEIKRLLAADANLI